MNAKKFSDFTPLRKLTDIDSLKLYKENPCQFLEEQVLIFPDDILPENLHKYHRVDNKVLLNLEPFQREFINAVLATKDSQGYRYYDEALLAIGKKNGKSSLASYIATYLFFMNKGKGDFIFSSNSKDQADILSFGNFKDIWRLSPNLKKEATVKESFVKRNDTDAEVIAKPVPYADAANHGLMNLVFVSFDEPWGYKDDSVYTAFTRIPTKREFLGLSTSYAGFDKRSVYRQLYDRGKKGLSPTLYFKSYECEEDNPDCWKNANPASWVTMNYLRKQKSDLSDARFKQMHLNMWVGTDNSTRIQQFTTDEQIEALINPNLAPTERGNPLFQYVCGVDLGVLHDNTAIAVCHLEDGKVILDRLDVWQPTREKPVSIADIENYMKEMRARYNCKFVVDTSQMLGSIQKFKDLYGDDVVMAFDFRGKWSELTELMSRVIKSKELQIYPNAGFHYDERGNRNTFQTEVTALYVKWLPNGSIRLDHLSTRKSDMTTAIAMCIYELIGFVEYGEPSIRDPLGDLYKEREREKELRKLHEIQQKAEKEGQPKVS